MVTDENDKAETRMEEYNQKGYPTGFYDGGYEVVVGGGYNESYHENIIIQSGSRDVHDLEFILSAESVKNGELNISISIKNIEELNPKRYGIIVKSDQKSALLLPELDGINTVEKQILICCQKAGINIKEEKISIFRFTVEKYE